MRLRLLTVVILLCGTALPVAMPAGAEIFKCPGPDGKTIFTSDSTACPGRKPHELRRDLQTVRTRSSAGPGRTTHPPAARRRQSGLPQDGQEQMWRRKRSEAERELGNVESQLVDYEKYSGWCNRGGSLFVKDEAGMKRGVSCKQIRSDLARMRTRESELRSYLDEGLADECRQAGCLPGWIR